VPTMVAYSTDKLCFVKRFNPLFVNWHFTVSLDLRF
jgi:hypothetical protein